jgi:hypothetical protein
VAGTAVVVYLSEKKNCDCATSFLEIYVQLYDFEKNCGQMKQSRLKIRYSNREANNHDTIDVILIAAIVRKKCDVQKIQMEL